MYVATVQALMRHANASVTMNTYVQAVTPAKRQAQRGIVGLLDPNGPTPEPASLQVLCDSFGCGVDLNHQPLGYEPSDGRNFNNLQDAGGARSYCKEGIGIDTGQLMDSSLLDPN